MEAVKRRLPSVILMPAASENEMIEDVRNWREDIRRNFSISLDNVRIDSCINGYGKALMWQ